jgi:hypothetical protein
VTEQDAYGLRYSNIFRDMMPSSLVEVHRRSAFYLIFADCLLGLLIDPEDGGNIPQKRW